MYLGILCFDRQIVTIYMNKNYIRSSQQLICIDFQCFAIYLHLCELRNFLRQKHCSDAKKV